MAVVQKAAPTAQVKTQEADPDFKALLEKAVGKAATYTPLGESQPINLSIAMVRTHFVVPTASGAVPTDSQLAKFVMLCKTQLLNPWAGDACITGYDTKRGPVFNLIVQIQALLKRAERCQAFDGIESGIIVVDADGNVSERNGDLRLAKEQLIGAWAKVYRKDRRFPFYRVVNRAAYDQQRSRWNTDPDGMLRKCAQAGALREAFPVELSGLSVEGEHAAEYVEVKTANGMQSSGGAESLGNGHDEAEQVAAAIAQETAANPTVPGDAGAVDLVAVAAKRFARCGTHEELQRTAAEFGQTYQLSMDQDMAIQREYEARKDKISHG